MFYIIIIIIGEEWKKKTFLLFDYIIIYSRFFYESEQGLFPNTEFVYDLELPLDFVPKNNDGEVDTFQLLSTQVKIIKINKFKCSLLFGS